MGESIPLQDFCEAAASWRQKRVREVLWQVFSRSKAYDGVMSAEACADGLQSGVLHVWSRPSRVLDVVFPLPGITDLEVNIESEHKLKLEKLIGTEKQVSFLDLVSKTDA